jgi:hypothetical protein
MALTVEKDAGKNRKIKKNRKIIIKSAFNMTAITKIDGFQKIIVFDFQIQMLEKFWYNKDFVFNRKIKTFKLFIFQFS